MIKSLWIPILLAALAVAGGCGKERTPSRDQIPVLRERLFMLQKAVNDQNRAAIDSLLSLKIRTHAQTSDSLLSLVYGPDGDFPFVQFGSCQYNYTHNKALVECYIMDSLAQRDRPILLSWVYEHDMWLLKRFEADSLKLDYDSEAADPVLDEDSDLTQ